MANITKTEPHSVALSRRKRVAAYARVSMESDRMRHSLSAQVSYYSEYIQNNPDWEYTRVYSDSFVSGTSIGKRTEFKRMIADCEKGLIDIILCKSISRFARNTVDLLETVRHLKSIGVEVRFEKENINTFSGDGELMLTLFASFAQQESFSQSENIKWTIRKKFENGEPWGISVFGYTRDFRVIPEEAETVRQIYSDFLKDIPMAETAKHLKESGCRFNTKQFVKGVLTNEIYTGDLLLQKYYSPEVRCCVKNRGELPKYFVKDHHEPIISHMTFDAVQDKMQKSLEFNKEAHRIARVSCFSSKLICGTCGSHYVKYHGNTRACYLKIKSRKQKCQNKNLTETKLIKVCLEVFKWESFDEVLFSETVHNILIMKDGTLVFTLYSGETRTGKVRFYDPDDRKYLDPHTKIYGYTRMGDEYIIDPDEEKAVKTVYGFYLDGMSISDISRKMTELGYKSRRGGFSRKMVSYILDNVFYTGTRIYSGEEVRENDHPAIITKEVYEEVRKRRKSNGNGNENTGNDK